MASDSALENVFWLTGQFDDVIQNNSISGEHESIIQSKLPSNLSYLGVGQSGITAFTETIMTLVNYSFTTDQEMMASNVFVTFQEIGEDLMNGAMVDDNFISNAVNEIEKHLYPAVGKITNNPNFNSGQEVINEAETMVSVVKDILSQESSY